MRPLPEGFCCFNLIRIFAVTKTWSLLNAISVLAVTSRMLFLKARGAITKSSCANLLGVHGALKPFVVDSLNVHFW